MLNYILYKETDNFFVKYDIQDRDIVEQYTSELENSYKDLCDKFHFKRDNTKDKYIIYICKDADDYIIATNKDKEDYQDWMVGWSDNTLRRICLLSPKVDNGFSKEELIKIITHEVVHAVFDDYCNIAENEAWLAEGIAILYANQTDLEQIDFDKYPLLRDIKGKCELGNTPINFSENGGYDYAGIYVWYFIKKYGFDKFLLAYSNKIDVNEVIENGFEKAAITSYIKYNI